MEHKEIGQLMFDTTMRAERILHFASQGMEDSFPDDLKNAFESDWEDIWKAVGIDEPENEENWAIAETLINSNKLGFLVQMATPVPKDVGEHGYSYSWGFYQMKWFYGESLDEVYKAAGQWQESYIEKITEKALKPEKAT